MDKTITYEDPTDLIIAIPKATMDKLLKETSSSSKQFDIVDYLNWLVSEYQELCFIGAKLFLYFDNNILLLF